MTAELTPGPRPIHQAMVEAATAIGAVAKNLRNAESHYAARSIDDVLDAVHAPLADAGIALTLEVLDRETSSRGKMNYVALRVAYTFHGEDGSSLTSTVWGEATDAADKAGNKALSAALKMALIQSFTIPVNGEQADADAHTEAATIDTPVPDDWTAEVLARLAAIRGDRPAYPREWKDADLPGVPIVERSGLTEAQHRAARAALDAVEARLAAEAAEAAAPLTATDGFPDAEEELEECPACAAQVAAGEAHAADCPEADAS